MTKARKTAAEIQECVQERLRDYLSDRIESVSYTHLDVYKRQIDNRYDVITSGSLLGIDYKRASSYPVGYVDYLRMYGMDFEEFLWGMGISEDMIGKLCGYLHSKTVIPEAIHSCLLYTSNQRKVLRFVIAKRIAFWQELRYTIYKRRWSR